jgi:zinc D-Ala-D-Ala carboxypeptidase
MLASEHFTLEELTRTSTGLENDPPLAASEALVTLAETLLEPIRALLGAPLAVHSGYRSPAVNRRVGGHPASAHLEGRACDFHPVGIQIRTAFDRIRVSEIPFDKLILEQHGGAWWIHVQGPREGSAPRRVERMALVTDSGTVYTEVR